MTTISVQRPVTAAPAREVDWSRVPLVRVEGQGWWDRPAPRWMAATVAPVRRALGLP